MEQPKRNEATARAVSEQRPSAEAYLNFMKQQKLGATAEAEPVSFLFADEKMKRIKEIVEQIANVNVPVLITGESGTGKEVIAQMIHKSSNRAQAPFVAVNCAALPPNLLESELFGYEKGAFTGAAQRHIGKFEQASGGTLLLDEVTEIEPALQAKLLRALQEKEIERIGGTGAVSVDTRIIATTNRDIKAIVNAGTFRQDLYYRLYVIHIEVPALRERTSDIEFLAKHFVEKFANRFNRAPMVLSDAAMERLKRYPWPGNVRELQNVLQRSILMSRGNSILPEQLPLAEVQVPVKTDDSWVSDLPIGKSMQEIETHFIIETLKHHNGNRTHAARTLGISLRTLRNKINEFTVLGLEVPCPTTGKAL